MSTKDFSVVIDMIRKEDTRFEKGAYYFVRKALDHTLETRREAGAADGDKQRHVSGGELLEGMRDYALEQYGPMAHALLGEWGIRRSEDFVEVVFNLVEFGVLGKTEPDRREDFAGGFDFEEAFLAPFRPAGSARAGMQRFRFSESGRASAS